MSDSPTSKVIVTSDKEAIQALTLQVAELQAEVKRLQHLQKSSITWDLFFHPLTVLAASLCAALAFAALIIIDKELSGSTGRHSFFLYYMVPISAPFVAFLFDRSRRLFEPYPLQWAVDLPVVALGLVRALYALPFVSGHALFLTYALLTCRMRVAQVLATLVLAQVIYLKAFVWHDPTLFGGMLVAGVAAGLFYLSGKWKLNRRTPHYPE